MNIDKNKLTRVISSVSFAINDLVLYLDTHPTDSEALAQYEKYKTIRRQAIREYTSEFGPLTSYDVKSTGKWSWGCTPMPWEGEVR